MASSIKYLLIDDVDQGPLLTKLKKASAGKLDIVQRHPQAFDAALESFKANNFKEFDGLLIDLRLNENRKPGQNYAITYRVPSLIQELRSRTIEDVTLAPECPFILLSDESKIANYYRKDPTSHDLFDKVISKGEASSNPDEISAQLISLVNGYKTIIKSRSTLSKKISFEELLKPNGKMIDQRITHSFDAHSWKVTANEYASFIIKQILNKPGLLINESLLASRFGVDIQASKGWATLLTKLPSKIKYSGIFSGGWPRWWAQELLVWWDQQKDFPKNLRNIDASDRVKILKKKFKITHLVAAKPIEQQYSSFFWTVCKAREAPLDPTNGFTLNMEEPMPWQEVEYISEIAALKKEKYDFLRVHPLEIPRYKLLVSSSKKKDG